MSNKKNLFVLFDNESSTFLGKGDTACSNAQTAKHYKRKKAAIEAAGLHNINRNIPNGVTASKHYRNRPQVVVLEVDQSFVVKATHPAPPSYIYI